MKKPILSILLMQQFIAFLTQLRVHFYLRNIPPLLPFLLVLVLVGCEASNDSSIEELKSKLEERVTQVDGTIAVALKVLEGGKETLFIHEREVFHAASTMKTPVMMEIYRQAEQGKFSLSDSIPVVNEFSSIVDGSPFSMDLDVDSQEGLYHMIGQKETIYELMYQMIIKSSNLATNILIDLIGASNVNEFMREIGANDIQVLRGVEDLKAFEAGLNNTTTALDMMLIMEAIATGKAVNQEASLQMMDILYDQYYKDLIPKKLPEEVKVAHKTGSITGVQHDAAILELPDGKRYVLVILSKELKDVEEGKEAIADISRQIYQYISEL
ncbi:serine hydrolase [Pleomorphovibrio marinus]|uniref:serine hydrolase n=1 Tax=Pleomorphovibrio marinus TaxID=2164132 RepID=UPI001E314982|nr:serine hydrolase [Pleomorphovibrio marinus]